MYDDLVKRLRDAAKMSEALAVLLPHSKGNATAKLYNEAADAIEELSRQLAEYHSYDGFLMAHGCFVELPEPPKEERNNG